MQVQIMIIALIVILGLLFNVLLNNKSSYNKSFCYRIAGTIIFVCTGIISSIFIVFSWNFTRFSYLIYSLILTSVCLILIYILSIMIIKRFSNINQTGQINANIDRYGYILRRTQATAPISPSPYAANESNNLIKAGNATKVDIGIKVEQDDTINSEILKSNEIEMFIKEPAATAVFEEAKQNIIEDETDSEEEPGQAEQVLEAQDDIFALIEQKMHDKVEYNELQTEFNVNIDLNTDIQNDNHIMTILPDESQTKEPEQAEQIREMKDNKTEYNQPDIEFNVNADLKAVIQNDNLIMTILPDEPQTKGSDQAEQIPEMKEDKTDYIEPHIEFTVNDDSKVDRQDEYPFTTIIPNESRINEPEHIEQQYIQIKQEIIVTKALEFMAEAKYLLALQLLNSLSDYNENISIKKQADMSLIKCFIALKDYNSAQKKVFEFLSRQYYVSTNEKTELKEIMMLLKDTNR